MHDVCPNIGVKNSVSIISIEAHSFWSEKTLFYFLCHILFYIIRVIPLFLIQVHKKKPFSVCNIDMQLILPFVKILLPKDVHVSQKDYCVKSTMWRRFCTPAIHHLLYDGKSTTCAKFQIYILQPNKLCYSPCPQTRHKDTWMVWNLFLFSPDTKLYLKNKLCSFNVLCNILQKRKHNRKMLKERLRTCIIHLF